MEPPEVHGLSQQGPHGWNLAGPDLPPPSPHCGFRGQFPRRPFILNRQNSLGAFPEATRSRAGQLEGQHHGQRPTGPWWAWGQRAHRGG